jgi:exonuclease III
LLVLLLLLLLLSCVLQETKLQESHVEEVVKQVGLQGWHVTFNCSTAKKGYSGTATLCR